MSDNSPKQSSIAKLYPESWERLKQVNATAGEFQRLWLGLLTFGAFLFVTAASVTHRDIFLGSPVRLPIIGVELPLVGFFIVAPVLFLVFHGFVLAKYKMLWDVYKSFQRLGEKHTNFGAGHNRQIYRHTGSSIVVKSLFRDAQMKIENKRSQAWFHTALKILVIISLVIFPVVVLLLMQRMFLPYQSGLVIWVQRSVILIDLAIIYLTIAGWVLPGTLNRIVGLAGMFSVMFVSWYAMTVDPVRIGNWEKNSIEDNPLWSSRLRPSNVDFVNDKAFRDNRDAVRLNLHERSFISADLTYADLRGLFLKEVDFRFADLRRASLDEAVLVGANFNNARLSSASFVGVEMDKATFHDARICNAEMAGADISDGQFFGADMEGVHLDGADLRDALFVATNLRDARLIGANLKRAILTGSYLGNSTFKAADFKHAVLAGSHFHYSKAINSIEVFWRNGTDSKPFFRCNPIVDDKRGKLKSGAILYSDNEQVFDYARMQNTLFDLSQQQFVQKLSAQPRRTNFQFPKIWNNPVKEVGKIIETKVSGELKSNLRAILETEGTKFSMLVPLELSDRAESFFVRKLEHICLSGSYPHVAAAYVKSGRITRRPLPNRNYAEAELAAEVLRRRCTDQCPGAEELSKTSVAQIWRAAGALMQRQYPTLSIGDHELPEVVYDCKKWKAYQEAIKPVEVKTGDK